MLKTEKGNFEICKKREAVSKFTKWGVRFHPSNYERSSSKFAKCECPFQDLQNERSILMLENETYLRFIK